MDAAAPDAATPDGAAQLLRTTAAIRTRAQGLLARARRFESDYFTVNDGAMYSAAILVAEVAIARYPELRIPYHSRWRHFEANGVDRKALLDKALVAAHGGLGADELRKETARAHIDLALVSVLLDAGAGPDWEYTEADSGHIMERSEGLAVASFHAFMAGIFSSDPKQPLRVDAAELQAMTSERLGQVFQVGPHNPLVGLEGRVALLQRLGDALAAQPEVFQGVGTQATVQRPGALFDHLTREGGARLRVADLFNALLTTLSRIWPSQNAVGGVALGDCWKLEAAEGPLMSDGWMPFHKLTQWLTYSLLEPFEWAGVRLEGQDVLTGLPEYRNGGLLLDSGVLRLKDESMAERTHQVGDPFIVEWRALTVALLDELAPLVREQLEMSEEEMPLACVLEGGTWAAGRVLAQRLRDGMPPLKIESDGTVF